MPPPFGDGIIALRYEFGGYGDTAEAALFS
jgi:hypothetical protein